FTEFRYSGRGVLPLRVFKAVYYGTVINCVVVAMVLKAGLSIAEVFLRWHEWLPGAVYEPLRAGVGASGIVVVSGQTALALEIAATNNLLSVVAIIGFVALYSMT